ncbi:hypothetical protein CDW55_03905 [Chryseobacterium sp. VAUSW3]|nr:hypothetical protein CDW55_03905 [Chryseobacterium sp. VAUSW3]
MGDPLAAAESVPGSGYPLQLLTPQQSQRCCGVSAAIPIANRIKKYTQKIPGKNTKFAHYLNIQ